MASRFIRAEAQNVATVRLSTAAMQDLHDISVIGILPVLTRRAAYVARFTYWLIRHRSVSGAAWLMAFEGRAW